MILFCLDNYSYVYDEKYYIKSIENNSRDSKKYSLYIIYSLIDQEDQKEFIKYLDNEFNPGFCKTSFPICYLSSFRNLSEIENDLQKDGIEIPENYKNIFGENVYYLFKYIKDNLTFENFVKKGEDEIRKELKGFYSKSFDKKLMMENLMDIIDNNKTISYDEDIFLNIPFGYIIINKQKENNKYSLNYAFPLVKFIINNLSITTFFIDINNQQFNELSDAAMSINFDQFINFIFEKENSYFGYPKEEIEKTFDEECLEKRSVDAYGEQLYQFEDVLKVLEENKTQKLFDLINKYEDTNLLVNKNLIFVFQKFQGKFVDILLLIRKGNTKDFSVVNLQIKMSNSFKLSKKDKQMQPYQMTYLKHKYEYIFHINITDAYIVYISLYESKKKFAEDNQDLFIFYSKQKSTFVDKDNNNLNEFPFSKLINAKVELVSDLNIFINYYKNRLQSMLKMKVNLVKIDKITNGNMMEIEIMKDIINVIIKFNNTIKSFAETNENKFKEQIIYYEIIQDKYK